MAPENLQQFGSVFQRNRGSVLNRVYLARPLRVRGGEYDTGKHSVFCPLVGRASLDARETSLSCRMCDDGGAT